MSSVNDNRTKMLSPLLVAKIHKFLLDYQQEMRRKPKRSKTKDLVSSSSSSSFKSMFGDMSACGGFGGAIPDPTTANALQTSTVVVLRRKPNNLKNSPFDGVPISNYRFRHKDVWPEVFDWIVHFLWLKNCPIELATVVASKISQTISMEALNNLTDGDMTTNHNNNNNNINFNHNNKNGNKLGDDPHHNQNTMNLLDDDHEQDEKHSPVLVDSLLTTTKQTPNTNESSSWIVGGGTPMSMETLDHSSNQSSLPNALCSVDVARQSREMVDEYLDELGSNPDQAIAMVDDYLNGNHQEVGGGGSSSKSSDFGDSGSEIFVKNNDNNGQPSVGTLTSSIYAMKNLRPKMEDRHIIIQNLNKTLNLNLPKQYSYYAIFDGHAGIDAASYSTAHLHHYLVESEAFREGRIEEAFHYAFEQTDSLYIKRCHEDGVDKLKPSGTTALCALIENNKTVYLAWAGDSQAVLVRNGLYEDIMLPHKPDLESEKTRIQDLGGFVIYSDTWRVNGVLSVTRAIGDPEHKPLIIAEPSFAKFEIDSTIDFLVLGCDGLFDQLTSQDITSHVFEYLCKNETSDPEEVMYNVSAYLSEMAVHEGSSDNITSIVVFFKPFEQLVATGYPGGNEQQLPSILLNNNNTNTNGVESCLVAVNTAMPTGFTAALPTTNGGHFPYTDFSELPIGTNFKLVTNDTKEQDNDSYENVDGSLHESNDKNNLFETNLDQIDDQPPLKHQENRSAENFQIESNENFSKSEFTDSLDDNILQQPTNDKDSFIVEQQQQKTNGISDYEGENDDDDDEEEAGEERCQDEFDFLTSSIKSVDYQRQPNQNERVEQSVDEPKLQPFVEKKSSIFDSVQQESFDPSYSPYSPLSTFTIEKRDISKSIEEKMDFEAFNQEKNPSIEKFPTILESSNRMFDLSEQKNLAESNVLVQSESEENFQENSNSTKITTTNQDDSSLFDYQNPFAMSRELTQISSQLSAAIDSNSLQEENEDSIKPANNTTENEQQPPENLSESKNELKTNSIRNENVENVVEDIPNVTFLQHQSDSGYCYANSINEFSTSFPSQNKLEENFCSTPVQRVVVEEASTDSNIYTQSETVFSEQLINSNQLSNYNDELFNQNQNQLLIDDNAMPTLNEEKSDLIELLEDNQPEQQPIDETQSNLFAENISNDEAFQSACDKSKLFPNDDLTEDFQKPISHEIEPVAEPSVELSEHLVETFQVPSVDLSVDNTNENLVHHDDHHHHQTNKALKESSNNFDAFSVVQNEIINAVDDQIVAPSLNLVDNLTIEKPTIELQSFEEKLDNLNASVVQDDLEKFGLDLVNDQLNGSIVDDETVQIKTNSEQVSEEKIVSTTVNFDLSNAAVDKKINGSDVKVIDDDGFIEYLTIQCNVKNIDKEGVSSGFDASKEKLVVLESKVQPVEAENGEIVVESSEDVDLSKQVSVSVEEGVETVLDKTENKKIIETVAEKVKEVETSKLVAAVKAPLSKLATSASKPSVAVKTASTLKPTAKPSVTAAPKVGVSRVGTAAPKPKVSSTLAASKALKTAVPAAATKPKPATAVSKVNGTLPVAKKPTVPVASKINTRTTTAAPTRSTPKPTGVTAKTTTTLAAKPAPTRPSTTIQARVSTSQLKSSTAAPNKPTAIRKSLPLSTTLSTTNKTIGVASKSTATTAKPTAVSAASRPKPPSTTAVGSKISSLRPTTVAAASSKSIKPPVTKTNETAATKITARKPLLGASSTATKKIESKPIGGTPNGLGVKPIVNGGSSSLSKSSVSKRTSLIQVENSLKQELEDALVMNQQQQSQTPAV